MQFLYMGLLQTRQCKITSCFFTDPDMPFVPSIPEDQFILVEEGDPAVIPCRTSDPDAQVTLVNSLDKSVHALYDTKQGFIGNFPAGSYICKTMVKGVEFKSDEFLIYIIRGIYFCSLKNKKKAIVLFLHTVRATASWGYIRYFSNDELLAPLAVLPVT